MRITILLMILLSPSLAFAHGMNHRVEEKGVSICFSYGANDPVSYAAYEVFGPDDTVAHKTGRTDRNGFVSFFPDRAGTWSVTVSDDTEHGLHAKKVTIEVSEDLSMASYQKPFVAEYITVFIGLSVILFLYSLWVHFGLKRRGASRPGTPNDGL